MKRENWGSRMGFVLAAAGSAVGLGNIWKFPYVTGENGGGAFLLAYLAIVAVFGFSILLGEIAIGRNTNSAAPSAFERFTGKKFMNVFGIFGMLAAFLILSFYSVVAGWTMNYTILAATNAFEGLTTDQLGEQFGGFITNPTTPLIYHAIFMAVTVYIVARGIENGIEKYSRILMPVLFASFALLLVRSLTLPGAGEGVAFMLYPDFSKITWDVLGNALGMAFFSLSLGMATLLTYGSYLKKDVNITKSAFQVTVLDSGVAIVAGLIIMPAVFAFGFDPAAGPGLTFITLPAVFEQMFGGYFIGTLFFALLLVAALTSAISILEVIVAGLIEKGISRPVAAVISGAVMFVAGVYCSWSLNGQDAQIAWFNEAGSIGLFDAFDYISANILLPLGGVGVAVAAGWFAWDRVSQEVNEGGEFAFMNVWKIILRFVAPIVILYILISSNKPLIEAIFG